MSLMCQCLRFDGADDYVEVPHSGSLYLDGNFTVLCLATLERTPDTWRGAVDKGRPTHNDFWFLSKNGENRFLWGIGFTDDTSQEQEFPLVALKAWNLYAFGIEGSELFMSFNGGPLSRVQFSKTRKIGTLKITLGCENDLTAFERIKINAIRIYNRALSGDEIRKAFRGEEITDGCVLKLTGRGISPPKWFDESGNNNHGSISGALKEFI